MRLQRAYALQVRRVGTTIISQLFSVIESPVSCAVQNYFEY
jgi:hypothetical protein